MRKYFCDSCEKEINQPNVFQVPCHIYSKRGEAGYVDPEWNRVSGKMDSIDLCNKCINQAYVGALDNIGLLNAR